MRKSSQHASTVAALLLLALTASQATASTKATSSLSKVIASSSNISPLFCPSQSLNYITQTLPKQCFTTSWASKVTSQEEATQRETQTLIKPHEQITGVREDTAFASVPQADISSEDSRYSSTTPVISPITTASSEPASRTFNAEPASTPRKTIDADPQAETDSPLDNANFLSFEEWKKQNLAKAGQSADNLGLRVGENEPRRRLAGINNALDSLGEDSEIEIDFGGFVNPGASRPLGSSGDHGTESSDLNEKDDNAPGMATYEHSGVHRKGKDAGKTCKERSNYASFDCAATMMKTNKESQGSTAVLMENRDSYMLNICSAKNKFFIVELCDDILIDTVVLANFEFFSSMFRTFRVSVSDRYPVKPDKWKELGTYEARNIREVQAFLVGNPLIWARYLRVEILTHFGNEYYCPISLLRVHGTTMMEEFNHDLKKTGIEEDSDNEIGESEEETGTDPPLSTVSIEETKSQVQKSSRQVTEVASRSSSASNSATVDLRSLKSPDRSNYTDVLNHELLLAIGFTPHNNSISRQMEVLFFAMNHHNQSCRPENGSEAGVPGLPMLSEIDQSTTSVKVANATDSIIVEAVAPSSSTATMEMRRSTEAAPTAIPLASESSPFKHPDEPLKSSTQNSIKTQVSSTQPPIANPTTQESFFKSVHKRLQLLESNSTLSLQYIEEQSRILRNAFSKVEKLQLAKSTTFLETLNTTVLTELRDFRHQYDQIWQSTVLELSSQREQSQREVFALSARLTLLADEILFQKRVAIIQFVLILLCLVLAIFSRSNSSAGYLELPPVVQNAINKSSVSLSRYNSYFESPPLSPSHTRPSSGYGLFRSFTHRRGLSDESHVGATYDGRKRPNIEYSPPTPTSQSSSRGPQDYVARAEGEGDSSDGSPHAEPNAVRQTRSSPATPSGKREEQRDLGQPPPPLRPGADMLG